MATGTAASQQAPAGLRRDAIGLLVTQAVESPLANVCDTDCTSIAKMPKRCLRQLATGL